ncbi:hypothetical protein L596_017360 [Steinernema carpocapsae]|uniref:Uncharacterized protein n=1 Tax=Steinernema carpocapsae TaxID=34508 RepID=A0A4U5N268_STECR|nr:hypothetical protein L596_017360 [Steinernema carpocapsae]
MSHEMMTFLKSLHVPLPIKTGISVRCFKHESSDLIREVSALPDCQLRKSVAYTIHHCVLKLFRGHRSIYYYCGLIRIDLPCDSGVAICSSIRLVPSMPYKVLLLILKCVKPIKRNTIILAVGRNGKPLIEEINSSNSAKLYWTLEQNQFCHPENAVS